MKPCRNEPYNSIGERIRQLRKLHGLSQEEFAYKIGVSKQTISAWESGDVQPGIDKVQTIFRIFNIDATRFLSDSYDGDISSCIKSSKEIEAETNRTPQQEVAADVAQYKQFINENRPIKINKKTLITIISVGVLALICMIIFASFIFPISSKNTTSISSFHVSVDKLALISIIAICSIGFIILAIKMFIKYKKNNKEIGEKDD